MTPTWRDLSDDELEARLVQRGWDVDHVRAVVRVREMPGGDEAIDRILGDER